MWFDVSPTLPPVQPSSHVQTTTERGSGTGKLKLTETRMQGQVDIVQAFRETC